MNRRLISSAFSQIDEDLIAEAVGSHRPASERTFLMENRTVSHRRPLRRIAVLALAACLLLALSVTAFAADWFGLRELFANANRGEMPEEATELIVAQDAEAEGAGWRARVQESYCDESTLLVTVRILAGEDCIVAPTDEGPNSPLWTIGLSGEGRLGEYAAAQGKTLLFVGAGLDWEALGLSSSSERFESASPQEMTILIEGARSAGESVPESTVTLTAVPYDPVSGTTGEVERLTLPVVLTEGRSELIGVYAPDEASAVPGVELGALTLTQTPLGLALRLEFSVTDREKAEELLTLRLEGVEFHGDGVISLDEGFAAFRQGQGAAGEDPRLAFLDWDKNTAATVSFSKIG